MKLSAAIAPGSVVFFLSGYTQPTTGDELTGTSDSDTFLDATLRELLAVIAAAVDDSPGETGLLSERIRRLGAEAAGRLDRLARRSLDSDIEVDIGWRSTAGKASP